MDYFQLNTDAKTLKRNLTLRFVILLSMFMLLLIISYVFVSITISSNKNDSILLNVAGFQRSLIRQYTSEINQTLIRLAVSDMESALLGKKKADLTARLFEKTLKAFNQGGEITITTWWGAHPDKVFGHGEHNINIHDNNITINKIENKEIRTHLDHVYDEWLELKRIAFLSLRSNTYSISNSPYIHQLLEHATITVEQMDHVVELMQHKSEQNLNKLDRLLLLMIIVGSILFLILIYFVQTHIVNPLGLTIGDLHEATQKLEVEKQRAEKASKIKSDFLSSMSHELRTPMNAILGFSQIIQLDNKNLTKIQVENINEILMAGNHLMSLINEVLDLAKIESGKIDITFEVVNFDDLIPECVSIIKPQSDLRCIEIIDNISCKGFSLQADRRRLKQVIINLLSNAVKYNCDNGKIILDSELIDNKAIRVKITDTGSGIAEENIEKLFFPFERLHKHSNVEGTGIGLAVTKNLVELMCGSIGLESKINKGSTFWIEFLLEDKAA